MGRLADAWSIARFGLDFAVLRRDRPFVLGLAVTDRCNLRCQHCRVWRPRAAHMPLPRVERVLRRFHDRGSRLLYLEGGEPYLWRDGSHRLESVIRLARDIGYLRVHVYTNGTLPITAPADFTWISADGMHATNEALRGSALDQVLGNAAVCGTPKALIYTVNTRNRGDIEPFLRHVQGTLPGMPVMFQLHTPYYGLDDLVLAAEARQEVVAILLRCKRAGLPVLNSVPGLGRLRPGQGSGPRTLWCVVDARGEYPCCRALGDPGVCQHCGYAACEEILLARNFHPRAIASLWACL